jgi:hypothetical protein
MLRTYSYPDIPKYSKFSDPPEVPVPPEILTGSDLDPFLFL